MKEEAKKEQEMRDSTVPWPKSLTDLVEYIESLTDRQHDYGTVVYAMSMAAVAAFNYVASKEGCTGFQASCADLDILRRTRSMEGPFMFLKAEDMCYPQYDLREKLEEAMAEWGNWVAGECKKKLGDNGDNAHPNVVSHWKMWADKYQPESSE